jgi:ribonuclease BN (tRNA processing enzyme)
MTRVTLTTLGTGTPRPEPRRHATCVLLTIGGDHLLFDCGRGAVLQLAKKNIDWSRLTRLFITHHHIDHIGELPDLLITSWINGRSAPMRIVGPPPTKSVVSQFLDGIYARDLTFREVEFASNGRPELATFAAPEVHEVIEGIAAEGRGWTVRSFEVNHGSGQFEPSFRTQWICLGYRIEVGSKVVAISGDTIPCDGLLRLAEGADLLLQCCWLPSRELTSDYLKAVAHHTLACSDVVGKIARQAGVKRLVLTHTRAVTSTSIAAMIEEAGRDFDGPIAVAEDLDEFEI